jgi:dihydropyrimidinase
LHLPFADDLTTGSQAALAGGITTVGTFSFPEEHESMVDALDDLSARASAVAISDVFLHASSWPPTPQVIGAMSTLTDRGQPSFKLYMPASDFYTHVPAVVELLEAAHAAGVVTLVHCEDSTILAAMARRLVSAKQSSLDHYRESRPVLAEVAATEQIAALCEVTGAPVYAVHLSCARALDVCRRARRARLPLYVETRPLYLYLTEEKLAGPDGPLFIGQPPLRSQADAEALWVGLADGSIDVLATDHAPWTRAQKLDASLTVGNLRPGVSDLQFMLPMFFSEGVRKRRLPLERFVAVTSTNAARIFGLYPQKGVIQENASADIVVWDPERVQTVRAELDLSRADYSVYEGWEVTGWPVLAIRRGEVVCEDGHVTGAAGSGRVVARSPWRSEQAPL